MARARPRAGVATGRRVTTASRRQDAKIDSMHIPFTGRPRTQTEVAGKQFHPARFGVCPAHEMQTLGAVIDAAAVKAE